MDAWRALKRLAFLLLVCVLSGGCASLSSKPAKPTVSAKSPVSEDGTPSEDVPAIQWLENEALVEWAVARLAAACNEAATATASPAAFREALRFKAAFATSGYAIMSGRNPLVQVLDLVATAELLHQVWIVEGRAASEFGLLSPPIEQALLDIRERTRMHALTRMSANELREVEEMVRSWREAHPRAAVVEFIRFEAFADEYTRQLGKTPDLGGMFGRISGGALSLEMVGERALILLSPDAAPGGMACRGRRRQHPGAPRSDRGLERLETARRNAASAA